MGTACGRVMCVSPYVSCVYVCQSVLSCLHTYSREGHGVSDVFECIDMSL